MSTGLNRAIAAASGEIIVRCDAHAEFMPGYIERAVAILTVTGAGNVGGRQAPAGDTFFTSAVGLGLTTPLGVGDSRYKTGGPSGPVEHVYLGAFRREALGSRRRLRSHASSQPGLRTPGAGGCARLDTWSGLIRN